MPFKNQELKKKYNAKWYYKNRKKLKLKYAKYYQLNKNKINKRRNKRIKSNSNVQLVYNLRRRVHHVVKNGYKSKETLKLLGCNIKQLWIHLEKSFKPGMTKENYGKWHVDHIRPCASFDLSKPEEQAKCFHYTNLQALWAYENISKGAKY